MGFRNRITADGSAGSTGDGGLKAEAGRYHLYVSLACPWAHCAFIFRKAQRLGKYDVSLGSELVYGRTWLDVS